jgi:hypothetical protein
MRKVFTGKMLERLQEILYELSQAMGMLAYRVQRGGRSRSLTLRVPPEYPVK